MNIKKWFKPGRIYISSKPSSDFVEALRYLHLTKERKMKVRLKTVFKLMTEGFSFDEFGRLCSCSWKVEPSSLHLLGTIVEKNDWHYSFIEEVIEEKKTYDIVKDFNSYITSQGNLIVVLKNSEKDNRCKNDAYTTDVDIVVKHR